MAGSPRARVVLAGICAFVLVVGAWNVLRYPPGMGYDGAGHIAYADDFVPGGHIPPRTNHEAYIPPGYYAVAGSLDWIAKKLGAGEPHRAGMALNVLFLLGTVLLVWQLAHELWPGRERLAIGAAAFTALLPVTVRAAAMFHPEAMSLFFCTLALWLCVRSFRDGRYVVPLGVALGLAQLVRTFALATVAAVAVAFLVARRFRALALVLVLAAAIPAAWYVHQQQVYGNALAYSRPTPTTPLLSRRPARFYLDPGIPDVITAPYRPHVLNLAWPTTYDELWGDYFGVWAWKTPEPPPRHHLQLQSVVGITPTLLAVGGLVALLLASLRSPPRLAVTLLPVLVLVAFLYFAVSYPSNDGDDLKATYMLTATSGWALGFGYAIDRLRARWLTALLALCALAELPFLVYR